MTTRKKKTVSVRARLNKVERKLTAQFVRLAATIPLSQNMFDDPRVKTHMRRQDSVDMIRHMLPSWTTAVKERNRRTDAVIGKLRRK